MPNWVLILLLCAAFVAGFFVGGRWKERALKAADTLKSTVEKL